MGDAIKKGILKLFNSTETNVDDYISLAGSTQITNNNMIGYLGAFEAIVDDLLAKNPDAKEELQGINNFSSESESEMSEEVNQPDAT